MSTPHAVAQSERWLARLMDQFGAAGLAAAAVAPGLLALVDQHAAAVRDILLVGVQESAVAAGAVLLAGYARGLLDGFEVSVRRVRFVDGRWTVPDWLALRLLGVCALTRSPTWARPAPQP